jgi:hypothetical protein
LSITVGFIYTHELSKLPYAAAICNGVTNNHNPKLLLRNLAVATVVGDSTKPGASPASSIPVMDPNHNA